MQLREGKTRTSRGDASWLEAGAGWPVVLLHAFPLNAEMWRPQLERVPEGWRFIAPDFRGFGRSAVRPDAAPLDGAVTIDDYAADVFALFDALAIDEAVVAGLSMGGYVAFAMYRQAPSRFNGLVLADTRATADTAELRQARTRMRELVAARGASALADLMLPNSLSSHAGPAVVDAARRIIEAADPPALDAALAAMMNRPDSTDGLSRMSCATLVLVGALDKVTPPADAEAMQHAIPRSTLVVIPEAGHLSSLEQPDQFSRALADFLLARM
jgi:pimeloyl-ACP methyl ester carboxylesterase